MATTAGSLALVGAKPPKDAFLVQQLRNAGALIFGKTNLSEWANIRSNRSTSGWSGRGGLTKNPYALDRNTSGSTFGSAAAVAANLCAAPLARRLTAPNQYRAERMNIRVFDANAGRFVRAIGTPGGYKADPWGRRASDFRRKRKS